TAEPIKPKIGVIDTTMTQMICWVEEQNHVALPASHSGPPTRRKMTTDPTATINEIATVMMVNHTACRVEARFNSAMRAGSGSSAKSSNDAGSGRGILVKSASVDRSFSGSSGPVKSNRRSFISLTLLVCLPRWPYDDRNRQMRQQFRGPRSNKHPL